MTKARDLADLLDDSGNIIAQGTIDGRDIASDGSKLDSIEHGATGDQTHSEIRALITAGVDTNVFTDADHSKLDGIEAGATADQTAAEIKTAYESNANTNEFSDAEQSKLAGIETGATADQTKADIDALNVDADTLDGQHGSYYTSYADTAVANIVDSAPGTLDTLNELAAALGDDPNFATTTATNIGTKANKTITVSAGSGLTGGGDLTANRTISHADTSTVTDVNGSGNTFIQDIGFDTYGHVTSVGTGTVTVGDGAMTVTAGSGLSGGGQLGTANQSGASSVTVSHADTSSQASVDNSNGTVIQDITLDTYGHITGIASTNLDGRYYTESEADSRFLRNQVTFSSSYSNDVDNVQGIAFLRIQGGSNGAFSSHHNMLQIPNTSSSQYDVQLAIETDSDPQFKFRAGYWGSNNSWSAWRQVFHDSYHPNADKWTTARTLTLSGDASGSVSWDGSANATLSVTVANDSHTHDTLYMRRDTPSLTSNINTIASKSEVVRWNNATTGRPASGQSNEYGPMLQMAYDGNVVSQFAHDFDQDNLYFRKLTTSSDTGTTWKRLFHDTYHPNADKWTTARTLSLSGDASGSVSWDGSANATLSVTVANDSHTHDGRYYTESEADSRFVNVSGDTMTGQLTISGTSPQMKFNDTSSGADDFWIHCNSNTFYILTDRDDNGSWDGGYPLQLNNSNSTGYLYASRLFADNYHPNADKWTTARTLTLSGDASGSVSWDGSANATLSVTVANDSHTHDGRYYTESEADARFTSIDHFRHTGQGYYTSTTTSALLTEALGDDAFDSKLTAHKTGWSYAGNGDLTDAGRFTELAGTSWLWWTDNSTDNVQGNVTALAIAPTTGGSAGKVFIYNNQGSSYSPGWREVWTSTSDGSGSGLDADLLDGAQGSSYLRSDTADTFTTLSGDTLNLGSQVQLRESTDRADLLQITSSTSTWAGLQIRNSSNEGRWSFMTDGPSAGFYDDENGEWAVKMQENGGVTLYHNNVANFTTGSTYMEMARHLDMNNYDIYGCDQIFHHGDTNTYIQLHAADQWRVVTGGAERLEVNNSQITSTEPIHAPSFHGDGSSLTGIQSGANNDIFWENGQNVTSNYTITNGKNAMSAGPITVNSGVTVTVGSGETWTVV